MQNSKKKSLFFTVAGILLIVAAMLLTCYNIWDGKSAQKAADHVLVELRDYIVQENERQKNEKADAKTQEQTHENDMIQGSEHNQEMASIAIEGNEYIGILDIPYLGLSLPVMSDWSYGKLKISPCVFRGAYYTDDLVIAGHNYPAHFSSLKWIKEEADVYLTTVDCQEYHYSVIKSEKIMPNEIEKLDASNEWDLTLFTCYTGGGSRCTVRCKRLN